MGTSGAMGSSGSGRGSSGRGSGSSGRVSGSSGRGSGGRSSQGGTGSGAGAGAGKRPARAAKWSSGLISMMTGDNGRDPQGAHAKNGKDEGSKQRRKPGPSPRGGSKAAGGSPENPIYPPKGY